MNARKFIHWNTALSLLNKMDYSHAIISEDYGKVNNKPYGTGYFRISIPADNTQVSISMCELTGILYVVAINTNDGYYAFVENQLGKRRIRSFMQKMYNDMAKPHQPDEIYVKEGSRLHRFLDAISRFVTGDKMSEDKMHLI